MDEKITEMFLEIKNLIIGVNDKIDKLEEKVNKLEDRIVKLEEKINKLEERIIKLEEKVNKLEERITKLENKVNKLEERVNSLEKRVGDIEQIINNFKKRMDEMEKKIEEREDEQRKNFAKLEYILYDRTDALFDAYTFNDEKNKEVENKIKSLKNILDNAIYRIGKLESKLD